MPYFWWLVIKLSYKIQTNPFRMFICDQKTIEFHPTQNEMPQPWSCYSVLWTIFIHPCAFWRYKDNRPKKTSYTAINLTQRLRSFNYMWAKNKWFFFQDHFMASTLVSFHLIRDFFAYVSSLVGNTIDFKVLQFQSWLFLREMRALTHLASTL